MAEDQDDEDDFIQESSSDSDDEAPPEYVDVNNLKYHDYKYCAVSTNRIVNEEEQELL